LRVKKMWLREENRDLLNCWVTAGFAEALQPVRSYFIDLGTHSFARKGELHAHTSMLDAASFPRSRSEKPGADDAQPEPRFARIAVHTTG
jgi:hypothetical protein